MRALVIASVVVLAMSGTAAAQCEEGARFLGGRCRTAHELAVAGLPPLDEPATPYYRADVPMSVAGGVLAFGGWTLGALTVLLTSGSPTLGGYAFVPFVHALGMLGGEAQPYVLVDLEVSLTLCLGAGVLEVVGLVLCIVARYRPPLGPMVELRGDGVRIAF